MAVVNEVITEFGYQGSVAPLTEYNNALGQSIGLLAASAAAVLATAGAVAVFITNTTKAIDPMIQLTRTTGESIEAIQELGFVASVSGSSTETLLQTVGSLSDKIGEAAQRGSEDFARLGISVRDANGDVKSASDVLLEVGQRFRELDLSLAEQRSLASSLGIDASLIQLMNRTGAEMGRLRQQARELGIVTTEQADAAASLNDTMTMLRFGLDGVKNQIAVGLAPEMERITGEFVDFLQANRDVIADGVTGVVEILTALAETTVRVLPLIGAIGVAFVAWKVSSIGLATVLGTVVSPVLVIAAGIAALILVVDDLIVAAQGGQSVIADFFQEFYGIDIAPGLNAAFDAFKAFAGDLLDTTKRTMSVFTDLFSAAFALIHGDFDIAADFARDFLSGIVGLAKQSFMQLVRVIETLTGIDFAGVGETLANSLVQPVWDAFTSMFDWLRGRFEDVHRLVSDVTGFFGFGDDAPRRPTDPVTIPEDETRLVTVRDVRPRDERDRLDDEQLNRVVRINDFIQRRADAQPPQPIADDVDITRVVRVEDLVDAVEGQPPQPTADDVGLSRVVRVEDLVDAVEGQPPQPTADDVDLSRVVRMRDVTLSAESIGVEQPDVDPVTALRSVGILNEFTQLGDAPVPQIEAQTLTRNVAVNDQFSQASNELASAVASGRLDIEMVAPSLQPQALNTTTNNESRSVTIENNNQFSITGDQASSIADSVADRLQDQLDDAANQLRVGGL